MDLPEPIETPRKLIETLPRSIEALRAGCESAGFDLLQPLRVGWYNARVEAPLRLENFGSDENLALVVGNTRALWPVFLAALARDPELAASPDPLDTYTVRHLTQLCADLELPNAVRFAHVVGEGQVAMQQLADVAGLAFSSESHQSVHPVYGPWVALRAAISVATLGAPGSPPPAEQPCGGCVGRCLPAFQRAASTLEGEPSVENLRAHFGAWLACRDACPVGREYRYSDAQIRYHYLRDRAALAAPVPGSTNIQLEE
jgi:cyanocobalamin reductase (cyanide-eliminating) / alkylcobalamin dealkylase